jgi:hypothetical protein
MAMARAQAEAEAEAKELVKVVTKAVFKIITIQALFKDAGVVEHFRAWAPFC